MLICEWRDFERKINERSSRPSRRPQELEELLDKFHACNEDIADNRRRICKRNVELDQLLLMIKPRDFCGGLSHESERDFLIRTGKITPFTNVLGLERNKSGLVVSGKCVEPTVQNLRMPGFKKTESEKAEEVGEITSSELDQGHSKKRRRLIRKTDPFSGETDFYNAGCASMSPKAISTPENSCEPEFSKSEDDLYVDNKVLMKNGKRKRLDNSSRQKEATRLDDGDEKSYQSRVKQWKESRCKMRCEKRKLAGLSEILPGEDDLQEWHLPCPDQPSIDFSGGFKLPGDIHQSIFPYQKTGVQWLWELHCQNVGGIIAGNSSSALCIEDF